MIRWLFILSVFSLPVVAAPATEWLGSIKQGEFTQKRQIKSLRRPFESSGQFEYHQNEKKLIWHTLSPAENKLIIDAEAVYEIDQNGEPKKLVSNAQISQLLLDLFSADINNWQQQFSLEYQSDCVHLTPKTQKLKEMFRLITLCSLAPDKQQIHLFEPGENSTSIILRSHDGQE